MTNDWEEFAGRLLHDGSVVFRGKPEPAERLEAGAARVVAEAYDAYALGLAGPPIPLDPAVAFRAGEVVRLACWALVNRDDPPEALAARLTLGRRPSTPSDHASADLFLRLLPRVYRQARALGPGDPVVGPLADVLRDWPLSGVLAGLDEGPTTPTDFGGHPGLLLLYAERFDAHGRTAWEPSGASAGYLELVRGGGVAR